MKKNLMRFALLALVVLTIPVVAQAAALFDTVFASANRTVATYTSSVFTTPGDIGLLKGIRFFLDITAETGTSTLDCKVRAVDPLSGAKVDVPGGAFAQKSGTGTDDLVLYAMGDNAAESANRRIDEPPPTGYDVSCVVGGTAMTFSVSAVYYR